MAYVYRHIRLDKNMPFYIGIGSDNKYKRANEKTKVIASATNTYSITKNDNLDLLSNSDTVYYCAKMLERNLQIYLTERFLADQTLPDITLPSVSYYEWMNGKGNVIQFSAN